jgi:hypothetical protein
MFWTLWNRKTTFPERRLAGVRREMDLIGSDIDALTRTVRSGGQVPPPPELASTVWRRKLDADEQAAVLPDWFPRSDDGEPGAARSERGFVRNEKFVDYLASNFQPAQAGKAEEPDDPADRRWVFIGLVVLVVVLYLLAVMHWR